MCICNLALVLVCFLNVNMTIMGGGGGGGNWHHDMAVFLSDCSLQELLQFPKSTCVLWDGTSTGPPVFLHVAQNRYLQVFQNCAWVYLCAFLFLSVSVHLKFDSRQPESMNSIDLSVWMVVHQIFLPLLLFYPHMPLTPPLSLLGV